MTQLLIMVFFLLKETIKLAVQVKYKTTRLRKKNNTVINKLKSSGNYDYILFYLHSRKNPMRIIIISH
jgi:hypothetical protein